MHSYNFEQFFPPQILKRGKDYFKKGFVEDLEEEEMTWSATVLGSNAEYYVEITLNSKGELEDAYCDCPYDEDCKHMVAMLYAIEQKRNSPSEQTVKLPTVKKTKPKDLKQLLTTLKKEQLIELVLQFSEKYPEVKTELQLQFSETENKIALAKKLIRQHLKAHQDRSGFIGWRDGDDAMQGIDLVLLETEQNLALGESQTALNLALLCFQHALEAFSYADDSYDSIGSRIRESSELLSTITLHSASSWSQQQQYTAFELIKRQCKQPDLNGWSEFRISLLQACLPLTLNEAVESELLEYIHQLQKTESTWAHAELILLEYSIISLKSGSTAATEFLQRFRQNDLILLQLIKQALHENDFGQALIYAEEGYQLAN